MNGAAPGACRSTEPQGRRGPWTRILLIGVLGGTGLGGVARAWMRLIADKPEFTWTGTLFIVGGFTVFGAGQALVAIARRGTYPRWRLTMVRLLGLAAAAPLFVAAGALLFPTVAGGGLALSRTDWSPGMRAGAVLVTTGPVAYVGRDLTQKFGWSLHTAAGFTAMSLIRLRLDHDLRRGASAAGTGQCADEFTWSDSTGFRYS